MSTIRRHPIAIAVLAVCAVRIGSLAAEQAPGSAVPAPKGASISGHVLNALTRQPIAGACVLSGFDYLIGEPGDNQATFTDAQGYFQIDRLMARQRSIRATAPHFGSSQYRDSTSGALIDFADGDALRNIEILMRPAISISGMVIDHSGAPAPNVWVTATPTDPVRYASGIPAGVIEGNLSRRAVTDAAGRFAMPILAPATFFLEAVASSSQIKSDAVEVTTLEGQQVSGIALSLGGVLPHSRGVCALGGRVLDAFGNPLVGLVTASPVGSVAPGAREPSPISTGVDMEGRYCFADLPPASYVVSASSSSGCGAAAYQEPDRNGGTRHVAILPMYYPGTVTPAAATVFTVDEKTAIDHADITIRPTHAGTATLHVNTNGRAAEPALVVIRLQYGFIDEWTLYQQDDRVVVDDVVAGRYTVVASAKVLDPNRDGTPVLWATADITSDGNSATEQSLLLEPGARVSARLVFDGTSDAPASPEVWLVPLEPPSPQVAGLPWAGKLALDGDGHFSIDGILPGRYVLLAADEPPLLDPKWSLVRATSAEKDVLDLPMDLGPGAITSDLVFTLTDRVTRLSGRVLDEADRPALAGTVIAFAKDDRYWWPGSRRVRRATLDGEGKYSIEGLPPGDYIVGLLSKGADKDVRPDLNALARVGVTISIAIGEERTLDLRTTATSDRRRPQ